MFFLTELWALLEWCQMLPGLHRQVQVFVQVFHLRVLEEVFQVVREFVWLIHQEWQELVEFQPMTLILDFALRGSAFDHQIPAPPPPPPARNVGGRDPYPHLLESQSAMSMLMMQMVREMNERSAQQLQQHQQQQVMQNPSQQRAAGQQQIGQAGPAAREMQMDKKWIPAMPVPPWKQWTERKRALRVQGLDRKILRLVLFNPGRLRTGVGGGHQRELPDPTNP